LRGLLANGVPAAVHALVLSLNGVLMLGLVNRFGVTTTAAYGACLQVWSYVQMPALAVGVAVCTMSAQCIGAKQWGRMAETVRTGVAWNLLLTGTAAIAACLLDTQVYQLFLPVGSRAIEVASHINGIVVWSFVSMGICTVLFGFMRATGAMLMPLVIHVLALLVVRVPLATMLMDLWQAEAIWWSYPLSSLVAVTAAVLLYGFCRKRLNASLVPSTL
jgi:Na+-driven multidrug efflux pump